MNTTRIDQALSMRREGKRFKEIGEFFGVSVQRATQMCREAEWREKNPLNSKFAMLTARTRGALFAALGRDPSIEKVRECWDSGEICRIPNLGKVSQGEVLRWILAMEAGESQ